jgi:hypothetical protein
MGSGQSAEEERKNYEMQLEQEWAKRQRWNISVSMKRYKSPCICLNEI